jgi:hypothetical protein
MATERPLAMVTVADPLAVASAWLVACTVTVGDCGKLCGAAYKPAEEIVPTVALPADMPLTLQLTVVFVVLLTVALKSCVPPRGTEAAVGVTLTVTGSG